MRDRLSDALVDMNTLISQRVTGYVASTHNFTDAKIKNFYTSRTSDAKQAYIYALLDLKRAEFVEEGMRWMDILRYKLPVSHLDPDGNNVELAADDLRKVWQLPSEVTLAGMQQNPR
jgi:hypothetical protein